MRSLITFIVTLFTVLTLSSCQSHEECVISRIDNLSARIEANGKDFSSDDWTEALKELEEIHEDMSNCNFTPEQLKKVGRADGKLTAIIVSEASKSLGDKASSFFENVGSYVNGFIEGSQEHLDEHDFGDVENDLKSALKDVKDWLE